MKKLDEMDRNIQLRAEEIGYRVTLLLLSIWTVYSCWQSFRTGAAYSPLPALILCAAVCVQSAAQMVMKRNMVAGDEEYREPNHVLWTVVGALAAAAIVLSVGTYFLTKA